MLITKVSTACSCVCPFKFQLSLEGMEVRPFTLTQKEASIQLDYKVPAVTCTVIGFNHVRHLWVSIRVLDMGNACLRHCRLTMKIPSEAWSMSSIVDNIFVFRCREITELLSCVSVLGEFIRTHSKVRIIVKFHYYLKRNLFSDIFITGQINCHRQPRLSFSTRS